MRRAVSWAAAKSSPRRHHLPGDPHLEGRARVETLAEEDELARAPEPDQLRQKRGDAARHEHAEPDLGEEAARALGHDREIAVDHPLEPPPTAQPWIAPTTILPPSEIARVTSWIVST